jgi:hypothetical protein
MTSLAWSQEIDADVVAVVQAIVDGGTSAATVFNGRATQGAQPPFVLCWPVTPQRHAEGLAAETWGVAHQQWQVTCHGVTAGQARYLEEQVTEYVWPVGWELVEIGSMFEDTTDKPATWFVPVTLVCRDMGGQATTGSGFDAGFDTGF